MSGRRWDEEVIARAANKKQKEEENRKAETRRLEREERMGQESVMRNIKEKSQRLLAKVKRQIKSIKGDICKVQEGSNLDLEITFTLLMNKSKDLSQELAITRKEEDALAEKSLMIEDIINLFIAMRVTQEEIDEIIATLVNMEEEASRLETETESPSELSEGVTTNTEESDEISSNMMTRKKNLIKIKQSHGCSETCSSKECLLRSKKPPKEQCSCPDTPQHCYFCFCHCCDNCAENKDSLETGNRKCRDEGCSTRQREHEASKSDEARTLNMSKVSEKKQEGYPRKMGFL